MFGEDRAAAKLKGYSCLVKFIDGEELYLKIDMSNMTEDDADDWFMTAERILNATDSGFSVEYFPIQGIAMSRKSIKYIMKL